MRYLIILSLLVVGCGLKPKNGTNGRAGTNGHSIIISAAEASEAQCASGGIVIITAIDTNDNNLLDDANPQSSVVCNGLDSETYPTTPVEYLSPCDGAEFGEVMLLLADGSVLSSFSETANGKNTRLVLVPDGDYTTTDGEECNFTLSTVGNLRTMDWGTGFKSWVLE